MTDKYNCCAGSSGALPPCLLAAALPPDLSKWLKTPFYSAVFRVTALKRGEANSIYLLQLIKIKPTLLFQLRIRLWWMVQEGLASLFGPTFCCHQLGGWLGVWGGGGCVTFPLSWDTTSGSFLPLVMSYLQRLSLIPRQPPCLVSPRLSALASLLRASPGFFLCHSGASNRKTRGEGWGTSNRCCYHGNCISELRRPSLPLILPPLPLLTLKLTSDEDEEMEKVEKGGAPIFVGGSSSCFLQNQPFSSERQNASFSDEWLLLMADIKGCTTKKNVPFELLSSPRRSSPSDPWWRQLCLMICSRKLMPSNGSTASLSNINPQLICQLIWFQKMV